MKFSRIIICTLIVAMLLTVTGCGCKHEFTKATCTKAATCKLCGITQGANLGHSFTEANCTEPEICTVCGTHGAEALGHQWKEATMDAPKTCTVCNTTEGTKIMLSSSVGKVLASGYEGNDFYELVATEEQSFNSVKVKYGVIKNNKWLRPLSQDIPFYDSEGLAFKLWGSISERYTDSSYSVIEYIGNGCFAYSRNERNYISDHTIIYNAETSKSYEIDEFLCIHLGTSIKNITTKSCPYVLLGGRFFQNGDVMLLDTNTMQAKNLSLKPGFEVWEITPVYEGIFAVTGKGAYQNNLIFKLIFIDLNGNKINKEEFMLAPDETPNIKIIDGNYQFNVRNGAGTIYTVTMDKNGNVIESKPKN